MRVFYIIIVGFIFCLTTKSQTSFELRLTQNFSQEPVCPIEAADGTFYIVGYSNNGVYDKYNQNGYLLKVSKQGVLLKDSVFYNPYNRLLYTQLCFNAVNNLLVTGCEKDSAGNMRLNFTEFDNNFNKLWSKYYFNKLYSKNQNILSYYRKIDTLTAICYGETSSSDGDYFIHQFKENGDSIKTVNFQYGGQQFGYDILKTDVGYKLITYNTPDGSSQLGNDIVTLDENFNEIKVKELSSFPPFNPYGSNPFFFNTTTKWINDSVYLASARVYNWEYPSQTAPNCESIGALFINKNDTLIDSRIFGKADTSEKEAVKGMDFLYKDHIYITGTSNYANGPIPSFTNQKSWIMVSKMDSVGNVKWTKYFGGDKSYYVYQLRATRDSGCVIVANYYDDMKGTGNELDGYILKLGPDGNLITGINEKELNERNFSVFPNPGNGILNIKSNFDVPAKIELYNALGVKIIEQKMLTNNESLDVSKYPNGIYSYRIETNKGKTAIGKWIKQ